MKHFIQTDIFKFVPNLEKINFVETYLQKTETLQNQRKQSKLKKEKPVTKSCLNYNHLSAFCKCKSFFFSHFYLF